MRNLPKLPLAIFTGALTACSSFLVWQAIYSTPEPKVVTALTVDSHNNSYVGGGLRTGYEHRFSQFYDSLLLKYDANGTLLWKSTAPDASMVIDVAVLNEDTLVVATGARAEGYSTELMLGDIDIRNSELWLVSATTGEFQQFLLSFDQDGDESQYRKMIVADGILYVAQAKGRLDPSVLFAFDQNGTLLQQWSPATGGIADIAFDGNDLYVTTTSTDQRIVKLNKQFQAQWSLGRGTLPTCISLSIAAKQERVYASCENQVAMFDGNGNVVFHRNFDFLLRTTSETYQNFLPQSIVNIDNNGDVYFASTRATVYDSENGPVKIGSLSTYLPTTLRSDVVIAKLDGISGDVLWSDDVSSQILPAGSSFTSSYYFPLALNFKDGKPLLTFRGSVSNYGGLDGGLHCLDADTEEFIPLNTCERKSILEQYAKTFEYDAATGKRVKQIKHNVKFPRRVALDASKHLLIAGDQEFGFVAFPELFSLGRSEQMEEYPLSTASDIVLQKYE